jgi:hypothetical protein
MERKDPLLVFLQSHREAFDDKTPPPRVWAHIERQLPPRYRRLRLLSALAAAVALLLIGGAAGVLFMQQADPSRILAASNPDFLEAEVFYQRTIRQKTAFVAARGADQAVLQDLSQLDSVMEELKKELAAAPKGREEEIIAALIRSYQAKIAILELVMERSMRIDSTQLKPPHHETSL